MKKTITAITLFLLIGMAATSCKKETLPPDLSDTNWVGTMQVGALIYDSSYLYLNANGTITGKSHKTGGSSYSIDGTWSKTPNSNKVFIHHTIVTAPGTYETVATLSADGQKLENGIGTNSSLATYNFTCSFTKQ